MRTQHPFYRVGSKRHWELREIAPDHTGGPTYDTRSTALEYNGLYRRAGGLYLEGHLY